MHLAVSDRDERGQERSLGKDHDRVQRSQHQPGSFDGLRTAIHRPDHTEPLPGGSIVLLFSDSLVEHPYHPIDDRFEALAAAPRPPHTRRPRPHPHPLDDHDDTAIHIRSATR
ncbi:hypothetical protein ABT084_11820 [Streptomyces sp. NPDC002138]|uniref:hypothetical protein n=1 Tax=Streptomyces sp. NPDC002138 TaxID=3154410 RepID=UPI00331B1C4F